MDALRRILIERYIDEISKVLGGVKAMAPSNQMYDLCVPGRIPELVRMIRNHMGLHHFPLKVKVGKTPSGTAATVERDVKKLHDTSTASARAANIKITISKNIVESAYADTVIFAVAHELSHVFLDANQSPLAQFEMAVDITAMMSGYAEYYQGGREYNRGSAKALAESGVSNFSQDVFDEIFGSSDESHADTSRCEVGYLTVIEVAYVTRMIQEMRKQTHNT